MKPKKTFQLNTLQDILLQAVNVPVAIVLVVLISFSVVAGGLGLRLVIEDQTHQAEDLFWVGEIYLGETHRDLELLSANLMNVDEDTGGQLLQTTRDIHPKILSLYVLDETGRVTLAETDEGNLLGLDLSGENYFQEVIEIEDFYLSEPLVSVWVRQIVVTAAHPIIEEGKLRGVVVAELDMAPLHDSIRSIHAHSEITALIVNRSGQYVAHPEDEYVQERRTFNRPDLVEQALSEPNSVEIFRDPDLGQWVVGRFVPMNQEWVIVTMQPVRTVLSPMMWIFVTALAAYIFSLYVFYWRFTRNIHQVTRPIAVLVDRVEAVSQGDYGEIASIPVTGVAELTSLTQSFSRMTEAVRKRDRELENRVRERTAQLEAVNQDLEAFTYSVSHDLRAPLRAILGFTQIIQENSQDAIDKEYQDYLEKVIQSAEGMNRLINDLLDLSRLGRRGLQIEEVDIGALAGRVMADLAAQEKDREISYQIGACPPLQADKHLVELALTNLFSNAIKFTRNSPQPKIEFGYRQENGRGVYYVRDNGVGFDMNYAGKMFDPFQRLHSVNEFEGTGIGLAIVKRIVRSHGGKIWPVAEPDSGATFIFYLES